jgi:hypothetical protein
MADFGTSSGTGRHIPYFLRQTLWGPYLFSRWTHWNPLGSWQRSCDSFLWIDTEKFATVGLVIQEWWIVNNLLAAVSCKLNF